MWHIDFLKILTSSLNALPKQWASSSRREIKTMADPQQKELCVCESDAVLHRCCMCALFPVLQRIGLVLTNMRHLSSPLSFADASWRNKTLLLRQNVSVQSCVSARVWERHQEKMKGNLIMYRFIVMNSQNSPLFFFPKFLCHNKGFSHAALHLQQVWNKRVHLQRHICP